MKEVIRVVQSHVPNRDRVIEDSRCPADVQCIQAGRLVVRATVLGGGWCKEMDLTPGTPVPVADGMLRLGEKAAALVGTDARLVYRRQSQ